MGVLQLSPLWTCDAASVHGRLSTQRIRDACGHRKLKARADRTAWSIVVSSLDTFPVSGGFQIEPHAFTLKGMSDG